VRSLFSNDDASDVSSTGSWAADVASSSTGAAVSSVAVAGVAPPSSSSPRGRRPANRKRPRGDDGQLDAGGRRKLRRQTEAEHVQQRRGPRAAAGRRAEWHGGRDEVLDGDVLKVEPERYVLEVGRHVAQQLLAHRPKRVKVVCHVARDPTRAAAQRVYTG